MPYVKKTWAARVRQHANRFTLTPTGNANEYDLTRVEGTVSVVGTPLSPTNLNDHEDAIYDAVDTAESAAAYVVATNNGSHLYEASSTGNDTYVLTFDPAHDAYVTGMIVNFKPDTANTGAATLNINSLGAKSIKKNVSEDLATGDILANQIVSVIYDGTNFQMMNNTLAVNSGDFQETTSISAASTYTKNVALGSSNFRLAIVHFSLGSTAYQAGYVIASTTQGSSTSLYSFSSSGTTNARGYNRNYDSTLSLGTILEPLSGAGDINLTDCYINGSNLTFTWTNTGGGSISLATTVKWTVIQ